MVNIHQYESLINFIAEIVGKNTEVVLHDLSNPDHSIVAIVNSELSGRKVGGSVTDWMLKLLKSKDGQDVDFISNYRGKVKGNKFISSSSYLIKDEQNIVIGAICVNRDITGALNCLQYFQKELDPMQGILGAMHGFFGTVIDAEPTYEDMPETGNNSGVGNSSQMSATHTGHHQYVENLTSSLEEVITEMIDSRVGELSVPLPYLKMNERMEFMRKLNEDGLFLLKGSITILSERMGISEPTVYRYLKSIKKDSN